MLVKTGLPHLCHLASLYQYFAVCDAWNAKVALTEIKELLSESLICGGLSVFLLSSHVRSRDRGLLRGIMSGAVRISSRTCSRMKRFLVVFVGKLLEMVIFSGSALTSSGPNSKKS